MRYPWVVVFRILADATIVAHLAFVVFVLLGGLLVLRWPRAAWLHLPGGLGCVGRVPARRVRSRWSRTGFASRAAASPYGSSFVEHHLLPLLYPGSLTRGAPVALGGTLILINLAVYGLVLAATAEEQA